MSGAIWFIAGLGVGIFGLVLYRTISARRTRAAVAAIRALAVAEDPPAPPSVEHGEMFRAARDL